MAKVYLSRPSLSPSSEREIFTIWMKSLVINGNGFTVYDSNGKVVYRIDNYDSKRCREVYLMDLQGNVLCTILRKFSRSGLLGGYKSNGPRVKDERPWFQVRKSSKFFERDSSFHVTMGFDEAQIRLYKIEGSVVSKSDFKITDNDGIVVAAVKPKQSSSGVVLGEDVMSLIVEPLVDHSFIMPLVAVYALIHHKM